MLALLVSSFSFGQGTEDFTNSNATSSYSDGSFVGNNGITWTYVQSRDANGDANGSGIALPALMLRRSSSNSSVTSSTISGGIGDFSVKLYKGFTGGGNRQVELFINGVSQGVSTAFDDFDEHVFSVTGINIGGDVIIQLVDVTSKQIIVDDITWTAYAGAASPSLTITSPTDGQEFNPETTSLDVTFVVQNFTVATAGNGDGHIHYTIDSGSVVMKYDTDPISLTGLAPGTHTVYMELVDDNHQPLNPAVNQTVSFTIASYTDVANLGELRAGTIGAYYRVTGEVIGTYAQSYRNQKWVQDATGGIVVDDVAGVITTSYNEGDGVINLRGKLGEYNGNMQLVPSADPGVNSTGNVVTPQVVSISNLLANSEDYESELVQIDGNVTFADADGTATFATGTVYALNGATDTYNMRTSFYDADYIGSVIPTGNVTMIGIIGERSGNEYFITPRNQTSDLLGLSQQSIIGFELFPNPVNNGIINITTQDNLDKNIQIFNVLGKQVFATTISGTHVNISSLNSGIYIIRVEEAGRLATRKLVIE